MEELEQSTETTESDSISKKETIAILLSDAEKLERQSLVLAAKADAMRELAAYFGKDNANP